jgi:hypothetical protein
MLPIARKLDGKLNSALPLQSFLPPTFFFSGFVFPTINQEWLLRRWADVFHLPSPDAISHRILRPVGPHHAIHKGGTPFMAFDAFIKSAKLRAKARIAGMPAGSRFWIATWASCKASPSP